jgi:hypothetical protein
MELQIKIALYVDHLVLVVVTHLIIVVPANQINIFRIINVLVVVVMVIMVTPLLDNVLDVYHRVYYARLNRFACHVLIQLINSIKTLVLVHVLKDIFHRQVVVYSAVKIVRLVTFELIRVQAVIICIYLIQFVVQTVAMVIIQT